MKLNAPIVIAAVVILLAVAGFSMWKSMSDPYGAPPPISSGMSGGGGHAASSTAAPAAQTGLLAPGSASVNPMPGSISPGAPGTVVNPNMGAMRSSAPAATAPTSQPANLNPMPGLSPGAPGTVLKR